MADFTRFRNALLTAFKQATDKSAMTDIGNKAAQLIRVRTRLGYGVEKNGSAKKKLDALSPKYIEQRKKSKSELHPATSPGKSNLTRSGQMLESIGITSVKDGEVIVNPQGQRKGDDLTNAELAQYVSDAGRPFNSLSKTEIDQIRKDFERNLRRILNALTK